MLDAVAHEVVEIREVEDNDMMFGLCELTKYPLGTGLASLAAGLVEKGQRSYPPNARGFYRYDYTIRHVTPRSDHP
jgi:hypothetical protein